VPLDRHARKTHGGAAHDTLELFASFSPAYPTEGKRRRVCHRVPSKHDTKLSCCRCEGNIVVRVQISRSSAGGLDLFLEVLRDPESRRTQAPTGALTHITCPTRHCLNLFPCGPTVRSNNLPRSHARHEEGRKARHPTPANSLTVLRYIFGG
jgi:hypothetical protein